MRVMKKMMVLVMIVAICLGTAACSNASSNAAKEKYGSDTMKLFLPGEYLGENIIADFEKQFGVKVIIELFDSNEMMYTKLSAGDSYDVLIPSDYMIERLLKEEQLQPLDRSMLTNLELMSDEVKNCEFDPDNTYSVPYFFGNVGIVYNRNNVSLADLEAENFDIFRDQRYNGRIYMYDSERDGFMMAFKQLGYSCNTDNPDEIKEAYEWLVDLTANMNPVYVTDEVIDYMMGGSKDLAIVYSGDAVTILSENEDMGFYAPSCGTNFWVDAMCIPANAENPKLANEFINYVLTYEASMDNTLGVGYASTNKQVLNEVYAEGGEYYGNEAYYPRTFEKDEMFRDNEKLRKQLSELWIKVKAAK